MHSLQHPPNRLEDLIRFNARHSKTRGRRLSFLSATVHGATEPWLEPRASASTHSRDHRFGAFSQSRSILFKLISILKPAHYFSFADSAQTWGVGESL